MAKKLILECVEGYHILKNEGVSKFMRRLFKYLCWRYKKLFYFIYSHVYHIMDLYWVRTISTTTALKGGRSIAFDGERAISSARSSGKVYVWNLSKP